MLLQALSAPSQPDPPTLPSQIDITTPPATAVPRDPKPSWCPACGVKFTRWQDRDRHIVTHLPHWIHCPLPHCAWRGNRVKSINLHWKRQDHLQYHESYGNTPRLEQFQIFNPQEFVAQIKDGTISASDAAVLALIIVGVKAKQLQKSSMSENPWGYKLKSVPARDRNECMCSVFTVSKGQQLNTGSLFVRYLITRSLVTVLYISNSLL
jgi:hypothetical protein